MANFIYLCEAPETNCSWVSTELLTSNTSLIGSLTTDNIPNEVVVSSLGTIIFFFVLGYIGKSLLNA